MSIRVFEIIRTGRHKDTPIEGVVCGVNLSFQSRIAQDGGRHVSVLIREDHPEFLALREWTASETQAGRHRGVLREMTDGAGVVAVTPAPNGHPSHGGRHVSPLAVAATNGWDAEDVAGAGLDDCQTAEGGYSAMTGLTLAELVATRPPPGWRSERRAKWPEQVADFIPPHVGWMPQAHRAKAGNACAVVRTGGLVAPTDAEIEAFRGTPELPAVSGPDSGPDLGIKSDRDDAPLTDAERAAMAERVAEAAAALDAEETKPEAKPESAAVPDAEPAPSTASLSAFAKKLQAALLSEALRESANLIAGRQEAVTEDLLEGIAASLAKRPEAQASQVKRDLTNAGIDYPRQPSTLFDAILAIART